MTAIPVPANGNPTPTADQLGHNPNPREHVMHEAPDNSLSNEQALEQQMEAAFQQHQQRLQQQQQGAQPPAQPQPGQQAPVTPQQPPAEQPPAQQPQQGQNLLDQITAAFAPPAETPATPTPTETPPAQPTDKKEVPTEDNDRIKYMQQLFQDTLGVNVGEAVETMTNFNQTAESTIGQMQDMQNKIALEQQRLDLMYTWGAEAQQLGMTASELVNQRLGETTQVFATLNEGLRNQIASQGSKGIIDLFNLIQKNRGVQATSPQQPQMTVPAAGRANIAETPQQGNGQYQNLSDVVSLKSEDDFWETLQRGYNDNLGVIRR